MNIYIYKNGQQLGPFPEEQLKAMLLSGMVTREDLSWQEGWEDWRPLTTLFPEPSNTAVTSPPLPPSVAEFKVKILKYNDGSKDKSGGNGTIHIQGSVVVITGKSRSLFGRMVPKQFPLCEIMNVLHDGSEISFDRITGGAKSSSYTLRAANQGEVAAIVALLPTHVTPEFAEQQKEHQAFSANLTASTPTAFVAPVVIALNVIVFVAMGIAGVGWFEPDTGRMVSWGADFWPMTTTGEWWRLVTSSFLHFGIIHLALNMWALASVGILAERLYGNRFFIGIYLFSVITSGLASIWLNHGDVTAGASGPIFGVYGAMLAYLVFQPSSFPKGTAQMLLRSSLAFVAYNMIYGFSHSGISNSAHLGGLVGGFLLGLILSRPLDLQRRAGQAMPRFVLGGLASILVISMGVYYLPKCDLDMNAERAFDAARKSFGTEEENVNKAFSGLLDQAHKGVLSDADMALRLESQVIPVWDKIENQISAINVSKDSASKSLHDMLVEFSHTRRDSYIALRDGLRNGDEKKLDEYKTLEQKAEQIIKTANQPAVSQP